MLGGGACDTAHPPEQLDIQPVATEVASEEVFPTRISNEAMVRMSVSELQSMLEFLGMDKEGKKYTLVRRLQHFWDETKE